MATFVKFAIAGGKIVMATTSFEIGTSGGRPAGTLAPAIRVENLWKRYGAIDAVRGISPGRTSG